MLKCCKGVYSNDTHAYCLSISAEIFCHRDYAGSHKGVRGTFAHMWEGFDSYNCFQMDDSFPLVEE